MSVICGIFSPNGDFDNHEDRDAMMRALAYRGVNGSAIWSGKRIWFGKQKSWFDSETDEILNDGLAVVADARIDNREDLVHQLGFSQTRREQISDNQLILAAYRKWGADCPKFLFGAFAFVIWDAKNESLFCCRDHLGDRPFFYLKDSRKFIFASEPKAILAVRGIETKINYKRLSMLVVPEAKFLYNEESWFEAVKTLPAGKTLTIDKSGVRQNYFWQPALGGELPYKTEGETIEALRELLWKIVGENLRSDFPVSALLSGGLDSSAIVSVAAKILEKQNKTLPVFSAVLPDENDQILTDERPFIDEFRSFPNVEINYVRVPESHPFENLEETIRRVESPLISSRHYLYAAFLKLAESIGSRALLDGGGGELGITSWGEGGYAEMFSNRQWLKLWRELNCRKNLTGEAVRYNLRFEVLSRFLKKKKSKPSVFENHPFHQKIADKFVEETAARYADFDCSDNGGSPNQRANQRRMIASVQRKSQGAIGGIDTEKVEMRFPLMDIRLIEFCLMLPPDLKIRDGFKRYAARAALGKVLPEKIRWRNSKCAFSPDYLRRYNARQKWVQDFLAEIKPSDPIRKIVDVEKLKNWARIKIADDEKDVFREQVARDFIPQGIYLIYFLRRFSEFRN